MSGNAVLGIVGCYALSDQILYLIDSDQDVDDLYIVSNEEGLRFAKKLKERSVGKNFRLIGEDESIQRNGGFSIRLWLNPSDLHNEPSLIQHRQSEVLSRISQHVDSVFFCYGLCRSSEQRVADLIKQATIPVTFLTDACGNVVDDCFAAILGGKDIYLDHIKKNKGTLFATTGYTESWKRKREKSDIESLVREVEGLRYMFQTLEYHRIMKLDDGVGDRKQFDEDVRAFSRTFDLELVTRKCHLGVFQRSYQLAKEMTEEQPDEEQSEESSFSDELFSDWFSKWEEINILLEGENETGKKWRGFNNRNS